MIEINLLGSEDKKSKIKSYNIESGSRVLFLTFVAVVIIEIVALALYTLYLNNKVDTLTQKRNSLKNVEKEVRLIKTKIAQVKLMTKTIKNLEKGRGAAYKNLKEIADVMPDGLWLVSVSKSNNMIKIVGKSFTTEAVAQYMSSLGSLKNVAKVNFDSRGIVRLSTKKGTDIYKFYITVALKG